MQQDRPTALWAWGEHHQIANHRSQKPSRTISVTQCDTREVQSGGENKTDGLNSEDKSLSAHPTSIWAPATPNLKWIQHFPSHYPFSLHWPDPIGSNQLAPPSAFNRSYFLILVVWKGSVISLFFLWLFVTRCLFDCTVLEHFRCFSHFTNCHMCSVAPAAVYFIYCSAGELPLVMWGEASKTADQPVTFVNKSRKPSCALVWTNPSSWTQSVIPKLQWEQDNSNNKATELIYWL